MAEPQVVSLVFQLDVEDGWPPVAAECLPFEKVPSGYRALVAPLFVKDLSAQDVIAPTIDAVHGQVTSWTHVLRSPRTTVWLGRLAESDRIPVMLQRLRDLGCSTSDAGSMGCYAIDVPPEVSFDAVDAVLATCDESIVAIAFPSFRHPDPDEAD
jgi:hypothetical protein